MRILRVLAVFCIAIAGSNALAAEDTSRGYANPSCSERNASANDCVIQDGPPRRRAFGSDAAPTPPAPAQAKDAGGSSSVTVLGGSNGTPSGGNAGRK